MKRNILLIFFILNFVSNLWGQNPLVKQWDKRFGGTQDDYVLTFQQTIDGGYILGGFSYSDSTGDKTQPNNDTVSLFINDFWVVKIDSMGIKQWDKKFGGTKLDRCYSLQQTADRGYILGGYSNSDISGDKKQNAWQSNVDDYWVVKIDSLGIKQWDKRYGGSEKDQLFSVAQTFDGGYILGGISFSGISFDKTDSLRGANDYWVVKIDSVGTKQWDKTFGGTQLDFFSNILQTKDGGYLMGGSSSSGANGDKTQPTNGIYDYWIVKIDSLGNKLWDKSFGGSLEDKDAFLQLTVDGGAILGGTSASPVSGDKTQPLQGSWDYWIIKIDSLGNKQWDKDFGGTIDEYLFTITQTDDEGFLLGGSSYSSMGADKSENNLGLENTWIIKTDSLGIKQWDKTIFNNGRDVVSFATQTKDSCYVMCTATTAGIGGYKTQSNWDTTNLSFDYWITKFCDSTLTTSSEQISNSINPISVYPNPAEKILTVSLNKNKTIVIFNILGEIILENDISSVSNGQVDMDISLLPSGIYFIKIDNGVQKFVKE